MELDAPKTTNAEGCKPVVVLPIPERALNGRASPVEVTEPLQVTRDAREQTTAERERQGDLVRFRTPERDNGFAAALLLQEWGEMIIETLGDVPFQPRSPGGEMKCPVCSQHTPDAWRPWYGTASSGVQASLTVEPPTGVATDVSIDSMYCANPECKQLVIRVHENYALPPHAVSDPEMLTRTWFARPRGASRPIDPLVPEPFRTDYSEAAAILDITPRMSSVLSRRLLYDLLEQYAGIAESTLKDSIDRFVSDTTHPSTLRDNLHYLREMGNFGAHTQRDDQAQIINVTKEEAEWTLDVVDRLFDYYIVSPETDKKLRAAMDKKLKDAGRKPISPPGQG